MHTITLTDEQYKMLIDVLFQIKDDGDFDLWKSKRQEKGIYASTKHIDKLLAIIQAEQAAP